MFASLTVSSLAIAWLASIFALLQMMPLGDRHAKIALTMAVTVGVLLLITRGNGLGLSWIRETDRQSDALAISALMAIFYPATLYLTSSKARDAAWVKHAVATCSFAAAGCGLGALAIGRSTWYWEFITIIAAGLVMLTAGAFAVRDRRLSANQRLVFGSLGAFGLFLAVSGSILFVAWQAIPQA